MRRAKIEEQDSAIDQLDKDYLLSEGWATGTLEDLIGHGGILIDGDWIESKDQDPNGDIRLIQLADIGDGIYKNKSSRFLTLEKAKELACTFLKPGDVLIARMPEPLGRACIFPGDPKPAVTAVDICIVRTGEDGGNHKWIMYIINSPAVRRRIEALQRGTTRKRVSRRNLASLLLAIPPLNEQKRIVAKVDELLARVNSAKKRLARVSTIIKRFRQAVLAAACSGRLTADWREAYRGVKSASEQIEIVLSERRLKWEASEIARMKNRGVVPRDNKWKERYKSPSGPDKGELPELDETWTWATIDQITAHEPNAITDGPFGSNLKTAHYTENGPRVVRLQNIGDGIFIDERAHISSEHFRKLSKHRIFPRDLAIATLGDPIPKACLLPAHVGPAIVKADCIRLKPHPDLAESQYLAYVLNDQSTRARMTEIVHGVGRTRLNLSGVKAIPIPLPPLAEQREIIRYVEGLFNLANTIEKRILAAALRSEKITQAILAKGFRGDLVPTEAELARHEDRSYEPASVLLSRIKGERATKGGTNISISTRRNLMHGK